MPRQPGARKTGGRKAGTPNKATVTRALEAMKQIEAIKRMPAKKLGIDALEQLLGVFMGEAARYQTAPTGLPENKNANPAEFKAHAALALDAAWKLAQFQTPRLQAVAYSPMMPPLPDAPPMKTIENGKVLKLDDVHLSARVYREIMFAPAPKKATG
jgi:hypothetical protein